MQGIPESEFGKRSHSRNSLIFGLFARMHLVEQVGSGIVRMQDLMHEAKLPPPQFQKTGIFTVTLTRPEKSSEKSSEKIIELIKEYPAGTIAEMAESLGKSTRAIEKQLAKLKSRNVIDRIGSYKDGYWLSMSCCIPFFLYKIISVR